MGACHSYLNASLNSLAFIQPQPDTEDFGKIIYQIAEVEKCIKIAGKVCWIKKYLYICIVIWIDF